jgi:glycosyltransferase involved in cell wall biosynthesis
LVSEKFPHVRFVIVGEGELRPQIEDRARELHLNGTWNMVGQREDYLRFMSAFDVFAFPSLWEGLPYAPIEAMAVGTPVVATEVVGTTDLVAHERTGLLVPPQDAKLLAQAIIRMLSDEKLARQLSEQARSFVESTFNIDQPVTATLAVYVDALARRRASVNE